MNITTIPTIKQSRGNLSVLEFSKLPFTPQRIFYINNVPTGEIRGKHAHYRSVQYLICLSGKISVMMDKGKGEKDICTIRANQAIFMDKMVWGEIQFMTGFDMVMVICSNPYEKDDYITDYEQFKKLTS